MDKANIDDSWTFQPQSILKNTSRYNVNLGLLFSVFGGVKTGKSQFIKHFINNIFDKKEVLIIYPEKSFRKEDDEIYKGYTILKVEEGENERQYKSEVFFTMFSLKSIGRQFTQFLYNKKNLKKTLKIVVIEDFGYWFNEENKFIIFINYLKTSGISVILVGLDRYNSRFWEERIFLTRLMKMSDYTKNIDYNICECSKDSARHFIDQNIKNNFGIYDLNLAKGSLKRYPTYCLSCYIKKNKNKLDIGDNPIEHKL